VPSFVENARFGSKEELLHPYLAICSHEIVIVGLSTVDFGHRTGSSITLDIAVADISASRWNMYHNRTCRLDLAEHLLLDIINR